ncbi:MAG: hypothetical protein E7307_02225 [Butyrivibrio sp.]|nr:hypothetical protein [Butyrivibrio sp.]
MKKRIIAALLAAFIFTTSVVVSFAENENGVSTEGGALPEDVTTGTQEKAQEDEVDVDADIEKEIQSIIPEVKEEIRISTAEELIEFAEKCRMDTWSANKMVIITQDISLVGKAFDGIPSFGGVLDGQGHTVSEVNIRSGQSYVGFFTHIQKDAIVSNLNVSGSIMPSGNTTIIGGFCGENLGYINECSFKGVVTGKDYVGGIAGINQLSGDIRFSTAEGFISGTHFTGGIAGKNDGNIANCKNEALVNTTNTDTEITIDSMEKLNTVLNVLRNGLDKEDDEANSDVTVTDIGGIAGVSIGIISRCINNGEIGYDHVGYNVGGIAGRQSGYLYNCTNNGNVKGRKDIGGIVGQAEPYITVDFATDIAYQLQEAVAQLHDTVAATLNDTKNQSDTITARLAVIQQFTAKAVEDTRFIAAGTVDFANETSAATTEAISRVDYVLEESSKNGGPIDNMSSAAGSGKKAAQNLKEAAGDLNIEDYLSGEDEKNQYNNAKQTLESAAQQYQENYDKSYPAYYNYYIGHNMDDLKYRDDCKDLMFYDESGNPITDEYQEGTYPKYGWSGTDSSIKTYIENGTGPAVKGSWKHTSTGNSFPQSESDAETALDQKAVSDAQTEANDYAMENYQGKSGSGEKAYKDDLQSASQTLAAIYANHADEMSDSARKDTSEAMANLESASESLEKAGKQTKSILENVAGRDDIAFPKFSEEYKAHTMSLADNLAGMTDNFGLLNQEVNGATGVLVNDLSAVNDQFNNILNLYTDALDGVLEKDYTNIFNDDSLEDAEGTTDATVDSCFNFGYVKGDIDISGIAGTMAIEYDFDKESDVTGLKDSGLNGSYLTKCVLRGNRNYGDIKSQKNYAGGVCGRQDMGTILNCGSYARIEAADGQYVGGVAGASISYIVEGYAKGELAGDSYVGGIAGDGKHIRDCLTIVNIDNKTDWSGAIAGHVAEEAEVRNNFFVSDDLAGIDRVSYRLKAEPVSYTDVINNKVFVQKKTENKNKQSDDAGDQAIDEADTEETKVVALSSTEDPGTEEQYRSLPGEFGNLTVNFVVEDDDLEGGRQKVARITRKYGEELKVSDYPNVDNKDGFYADWDVDGIERLTSDVTITATYKRYKTTLAEDNLSGDFNQSELLVDGLFHQDDKLIVEKTINVTEDEISAHLDNYEVMKVTIPDDGQKTHQIRFKAINRFADLANAVGDYIGGTPVLYLGEGKDRVALKKTGTVGQYSTYEVEGNDLTLSVSIQGAKNAAWTIVIIAAVILLILIIILLIVLNNIRKNGGRLPGLISRVMNKLSQKIENKEQIFYDDSLDEVKKTAKEDDVLDLDEDDPDDEGNE